MQRIFYYEEGVLLWKKRFFDKEVLLWKKSSTKKRKFYFAKRILFQMRRKFWYGKVPLIMRNKFYCGTTFLIRKTFLVETHRSTKTIVRSLAAPKQRLQGGI